MYSSPLVRAPKLQIAVEQPLIGGRWNLPQKETPRPKTKKLQQVGRECAIVIKSNPMTTGWVTHRLENNNIKEILALLWRFWILHQAYQPDDLTKGLGISRESGLEASYKTSRGLEEIETPVLEGTNKILHAPRPTGEEQWPHRRLNTTCQCWRASCGAWVGRGSPQGRGTGRSPWV